MKKSLLVLLSICSLWLLNGCGSGSGPTQDAATHFSVASANATPTVGKPFNITVTALDAAGQMVSSYSGTVQLTSSNGQAVQPASGTLANGAGTFSVTLNTAGSQSITATATSLTGSSPALTVSAVVATQFSVTAPATATAGTAFSVIVTALDAAGQMVTTFSGTVQFTSSNGQAVEPASGTLANGTGTFSVTLTSAGNQSITTTDANSLKGTSGAIAVTAIVATQLVVAQSTYPAITGTPINFIVTAMDASNKTATGYAGTVHFTSSDVKGTFLTNNQTLTNGTGTFSATLKTSGNQTITATDTVLSSITGTSTPIYVNGPATHLTVTPFVATAATRKRTSVTVSALDASNNGTVSYPGTVHFTSTDGKAVLPADATLPSGSSVFDLTFENAGPQTVTATDTVTHSITGTSASINVEATAAPAITSGAPPNGTVGSIYGPAFIQYLECVKNNQTGFSTCTPCVPNTSQCGGWPPCPRRGTYPGICILTERYVGFSLTATGGLPPYTWAASSLPAGLSLKPQYPETLISGTPAAGAAATYNVSVTVTDSGTPQATSNPTIYALVIGNPPPPVVSTTPVLPGATVNQPFGYTFTATAGLPPYQNWTEKGTLPTGIAPLTTGGVLSGTPTMTGPFPISVTVEDSLGQISAVQDFNFQVYQHGFRPDGSMGTVRSQHTATLLSDGKVLVAGGLGLASAEIYDPGTGKFTPTKGSMSVARLGHTSTLLSNGKVLITGGQASFGIAAYATAELFDPSTGMFTLTPGNMSVGRLGNTATLLNNGKVLITGGFDGSTFLATAELFDPNTGTFTLTTGAMATPRGFHTATLLNDKTVLVTGGINTAGLSTAELFDPTSEAFTLTTGNMGVARVSHTATLLNTGPNTGKVLVAGGNNASATAELYDPATKSFSSTGAMETVTTATATLLSDGTVLMAGGQDPTTGTEVTLAELYEPNSGTFTGTGGMVTGREAHTATLLKDGTVLVTGGVNGSGILATAELYQ
jgi:Putative Ig domain/Galactose oxidase, central domain/Kelch motif